LHKSALLIRAVQWDKNIISNAKHKRVIPRFAILRQNHFPVNALMH